MSDPVSLVRVQHVSRNEPVRCGARGLAPPPGGVGLHPASARDATSSIARTKRHTNDHALHD
eukprot:7358307-Prymnesium_polylepis.1